MPRRGCATALCEPASFKTCSAMTLDTPSASVGSAAARYFAKHLPWHQAARALEGAILRIASSVTLLSGRCPMLASLTESSVRFVVTV